MTKIILLVNLVFVFHISYSNNNSDPLIIDKPISSEYLEKNTFTISGIVIDQDYNPIPDWEIVIENIDSSTFETIYTQNDGSYQLSKPEGWNGIIEPISEAYHNWNPSLRVYSGLSEDWYNQDFQGEILKFAISGTITTADGSPMPDVSVKFITNDTIQLVVQSNQDGFYNSTAIFPYGWTGKWEPDFYGYSFYPIEHDVHYLVSDLTEKDFTGTKLYYQISGRVKDTVLDQYIEGVIIKTGPTIVDTTDYNGFFTFNKDFGDTFTITPDHNSYDFDPQNITINSISGNFPDQKFNASLKSYKVSGKVTKDGLGVDSVKLTFNTNVNLVDYLYFHEQYEVYTNDTGYYEYALYHGWRGTITPSKYLHGFAPSFYNISEPLITNITRVFSAELNAALEVSLVDIGICFGEEATLSPVASGGSGNYFYSWAINDSIIGNDSILIVSPEITTSYIIIIDDGTISTSDTATVFVHPLPEQAQVIQKEPIICNNQQGTRFSTAILAGHTYHWEIIPGYAGILFADNKGACIVHWNAAAENTKLILEVRNEFNCETLSEHEIVFSAGTAPQAEIFRKGNSNLLYCDSLANTTYTWGFSPKDSLMADNVVETGTKHYCYFNNFNTAVNFYWVELKTENACKTRVYYNLDVVGIVVQEKPNVIVRPVPFDDFLEIQIPEANNDMLSITLNDMMGRTILSDKLQNNGSKFHRLETNMVKPGVYILLISSNNDFSYARKVIKF